jgi:hypothetical protein
MGPHFGRTWGKVGVTAVACAAVLCFAACGSEEEEPPGTTPGDVAPIGELAGPTVPLDDRGFDNILALTVETAGEGRTLIAGQLELARPSGAPAEVRIVVDGEEDRDAEARQVGNDSIVIACACELEAGEHEVELQGRSSGGPAPIAARSLVALDGVEYSSEEPTGGGSLPAAVSGSVLETGPILVTGAPASLADLNLAGESSSSEKMLILAQIGSTEPDADAAGVAMQAGVGGEEADRIASITSASTKIDVFTLEAATTPGEPIEVLGNVIGGGNTELNLRYVVACPCGLETES